MGRDGTDPTTSELRLAARRFIPAADDYLRYLIDWAGDEIDRLARLNAQLIEAAKQSATLVKNGTVIIPAGSTVGFLFMEGGELRAEAVNTLHIGSDSQIGRMRQPGDTTIGQIHPMPGERNAF